jgi:hypothetical protein
MRYFVHRDIHNARQLSILPLSMDEGLLQIILSDSTCYFNLGTAELFVVLGTSTKI